MVQVKAEVISSLCEYTDKALLIHVNLSHSRASFFQGLLQTAASAQNDRMLKQMRAAESVELGAMNGEEEMDETAELRHELKYGITFPTIQTDSAVFMG